MADWWTAGPASKQARWANKQTSKQISKQKEKKEKENEKGKEKEMEVWFNCFAAVCPGGAGGYFHFLFMDPAHRPF